MKYSFIHEFEKSIKGTSPENFSSIYLLISKDSFERKEAEGLLIRHLLGEGISKEQAVSVLDGERESIQSILAELSSLSFFAPRRIVLVQNGEKLDKESLGKLEKYMDSPLPNTCLIVSAEAINRATKFYKKGEAAAIVLDIQEEKPWEKENNLVLKLSHWVKQAEKSIDPETARYLVQFAGSDPAVLRSEIEKVCSYVGSRNTISIQDIAAICTGVNTETAWQLGDAIFRREGAAAIRIANALLEEGVNFFAFIRQIRSQFQTKLHISTLLAQGGGAEEVQQKFPYMKGQILQQNLQLSKSYGMAALKKGILAIDEAELMAKNSSIDVELIVQRLILKISI